MWLLRWVWRGLHTSLSSLALDLIWKTNWFIQSRGVLFVLWLQKVFAVGPTIISTFSNMKFSFSPSGVCNSSIGYWSLFCAFSWSLPYFFNTSFFINRFARRWDLHHFWNSKSIARFRSDLFFSAFPELSETWFHASFKVFKVNFSIAIHVIPTQNADKLMFRGNNAHRS